MRRNPAGHCIRRDSRRYSRTDDCRDSADQCEAVAAAAADGVAADDVAVAAAVVGISFAENSHSNATNDDDRPDCCAAYSYSQNDHRNRTANTLWTRCQTDSWVSVAERNVANVATGCPRSRRKRRCFAKWTVTDERDRVLIDLFVCVSPVQCTHSCMAYLLLSL